MSKKANPTVIGAFVLGAIALVVAAISIFGSGQFLKHRPVAVAFFKGSIQGLSIGSAVTLRGVQVGSVKNIQLEIDLKKMEPIIPVYIEFDTDRFRPYVGETGPTAAQLATELAAQLAAQGPLKAAIAKGLHARLATQSLVTGQLLVELDLDPNEPRRTFGFDPNTVEIPTSESDIEKLKTTLTQLPIQEIANTAADVLKKLDRTLSSDEIPSMLKFLAQSSERLDALLGDVRDDLPKLMTEVHDTAEAARNTLATAQSAMADLRTALVKADGLLSTDAREAIHVATAALRRADKTLADVDSMISVTSPQRYDIDQALRNLTATTRALRNFAEGLERRPNSLVVGK
jgi:paraquat-inducible protein B